MHRCNPQFAGAQLANLAALIITAVGNTAANRRFTFAVRGPGWLRHHAQGLLVFGLGLALTSGSLAALHAASPQPPAWLEITVLTIANLTVTVLRFTAFKWWVFCQSSATSREGASPQLEPSRT